MEKEDVQTTTPSNLKTERFERLGFPRGIWETLKKGLPLLIHTTPAKKHMKNHESVELKENNDFVREALEKWEISGVFRYVQQQPRLINALKVITKENKKRLVLDARSSGLNECITAPKFALPNIEAVTNMLRSNDFMMKADLAAGFLQLPINSKEQTFLGFIHPISNRFCVYQKLPFGLASAPFLFQTFTQSLEKAIEKVMNIKTKVYMDDWILTSTNEEEVHTIFQSFRNFMEYLGVALQHEKTEGPTTRMVYLGIGIDTTKHELYLPEEKRIRYLKDLEQLLKEKQSTMERVAKMAGRLVHISAIHRAGMGHIQPLWNIMYHDRKTWTKKQLMQTILEVDVNLIQSLTWWKNILSQQFITRRIWCVENQPLFIWGRDTAIKDRYNAITICTDASDKGWGASTGITVASGLWSTAQQETSINWRELKTVILAIRKWSYIRNIPVLTLTDNTTVVAAIRTRTSQAPPIQELVEELNILEQNRRIEIIAMHQPGSLNDLPDKLSRALSTETATMLRFDPQKLPTEIVTAHQLIGIDWLSRRFGAMPFTRKIMIQPKSPTTAIAITTPDIPFLLTQMEMLRKHEAIIWILIPRIPSSHLPIQGTSMIHILEEGACPEAPLTQWWVIRVHEIF